MYATNTAAGRPLFYVVRCHQTDRGMLSVYAQRDADGQPRSYNKKRAAFTAAEFMGGRAAGFHVLQTRHDDNGELVEALYPTWGGK